MAPIGITRLHPSLGAEVAGVDLARPSTSRPGTRCPARWPTISRWSFATNP